MNAEQPEKEGETADSRWPDALRKYSPFSTLVLLGIFVILLVHLLGFARDVLIPVVLALFSYIVLRPVTGWLERLHVPRMLGAALTLIVVIGVVGFASLQLVDPAREWISHAPERISTIERKAKELVRPFNQIRKAADEVGNIAAREDPKNPAVNIRNGSFSETLLGGTQVMISNGIIIVVLLFFLLASGGQLRTGMARLFSGRTESGSFLKVVRNIESRLSAYLLTLTIINVCTGIAVGLGMFFIGMPNPILWGALAGLVNFVPYIGALAGEIIVGMVALFSFDSLGHALLAPAIYFLVSFVEGNFITPMILGRQFTISPVLIILSLVFWGWIWGIVGMFLAVPILVLGTVLAENIAPGLSFAGTTESKRRTSGRRNGRQAAAKSEEESTA
jgi:predicted PurR-regulated permease PerM